MNQRPVVLIAAVCSVLGLGACAMEDPPAEPQLGFRFQELASDSGQSLLLTEPEIAQIEGALRT